MYRCCVYQAVWCVHWKFQVKCSIICNIKFKFFLHIFIAHTLTSPDVAGFDDGIKWTYLYKITSEHQIHVKTSQKMNIQTKNFLARVGICPCCLWWSIPNVTVGQRSVFADFFIVKHSCWANSANKLCAIMYLCNNKLCPK